MLPSILYISQRIQTHLGASEYGWDVDVFGSRPQPSLMGRRDVMMRDHGISWGLMPRAHAVFIFAHQTCFGHRMRASPYSVEGLVC